jgi:hypothetical protein
MTCRRLLPPRPRAALRRAGPVQAALEDLHQIDTEFATAVTRRAARRLLIEAGGTPRTTQETLRMRSAARAAER